MNSTDKKVYIQDISTLEILFQGYILYEDDNICFFYNVPDNAQNVIYLEIIENLRQYLNLQMKEYKNRQSDLSYSKLSGHIRQEFIKFSQIKGLNNVLLSIDSRIINKHKKIAIRIFTDSEFEIYKKNITILNSIQKS